MKIDTHHHFWKFNDRDYFWMNDRMSVIKKDHLPENLWPELKSIGFDGSIAVQARQSLEETAWLLDLAVANDFIKGVVGWVDLRSPKIAEQLVYFKKYPKLVGVRHVVHDEPDDDFILHDDFKKGISLLQTFHLTYDLLVFPKHLKNVIQLVRQFPDQVFVLDHLAKPLIKEAILTPWKEDMECLAQYPNVYCKLSGMVTEADWDLWEPKHFIPYLDVVFKAFGTSRIMIGSDWPVCKVAGSYSSVMNVVLDYIGNFAGAEKDMVLGGAACKAYRLL